MYSPTTRVLTVLELLQSRPSISGTEIAARLEVDIRTARRYIAILEELGIPVTADRGRYGGYRLMPGFKLPPLMFNEEEAVALALSLQAARRLGLAGSVHGVEGALAKVERVLPEHVRKRVGSLEQTIAWDLRDESGSRPEASVVLTLSSATRDRRQVALRYRNSVGDETERAFDPYGLVCRRGRWYTIGYCHLRHEVRLFRLERIMEATEQNEMFERPAGFDVVASVRTSLGSVPRSLPVEVTVEMTLDEAHHHISADVLVVEQLSSGSVVLRGYTHDVDWLARLLANLGRRIIVHKPTELRDALRRHAAQIARWAEDQGGEESLAR